MSKHGILYRKIL